VRCAGGTWSLAQWAGMMSMRWPTLWCVFEPRLIAVSIILKYAAPQRAGWCRGVGLFCCRDRAGHLQRKTGATCPGEVARGGGPTRGFVCGMRPLAHHNTVMALLFFLMTMRPLLCWCVGSGSACVRRVYAASGLAG